MPDTDDEECIIEATAARLQALKVSLGSTYWQDPAALAEQQVLRQCIGQYGAWGEAKLPQHQRARRVARFESQYAHLLWPGHADD